MTKHVHMRHSTILSPSTGLKDALRTVQRINNTYHISVLDLGGLLSVCLGLDYYG